MNFEQAKELSFLVEWKAIECHVSNCWCRKIVPFEPILYTESTSPDDEEEYIIADAGDLDQQTAEYIVKLHNNKIEQNRAISNSMTKILQENHIKDYGISQ